MEKLQLFTQLVKDNHGRLVIVEFGASPDGTHHHQDSHAHHHHHHDHSRDGGRQTKEEAHKEEQHHHHSNHDRTEQIKDQYGIFTHGFDPQKLQVALQDMGMQQFDKVQLPPIEGMEPDHPFFGLPIVILIASKWWEN